MAKEDTQRAYEAVNTKSFDRISHKKVFYIYRLFVAGIDSDNNHKSSWYHTLKHRCLSMYKKHVVVPMFDFS